MPYPLAYLFTLCLQLSTSSQTAGREMMPSLVVHGTLFFKEVSRSISVTGKATIAGSAMWWMRDRLLRIMGMSRVSVSSLKRMASLLETPNQMTVT